jgi:hypothetical protein
LEEVERLFDLDEGLRKCALQKVRYTAQREKILNPKSKIQKSRPFCCRKS